MGKKKKEKQKKRKETYVFGFSTLKCMKVTKEGII